MWDMNKYESITQTELVYIYITMSAEEITRLVRISLGKQLQSTPNQSRTTNPSETQSRQRIRMEMT